MTSAQCRTCRKQVDSSAERCPFCGELDPAEEAYDRSRLGDYRHRHGSLFWSILFFAISVIELLLLAGVEFGLYYAESWLDSPLLTERFEMWYNYLGLLILTSSSIFSILSVLCACAVLCYAKEFGCLTFVCSFVWFGVVLVYAFYLVLFTVGMVAMFLQSMWIESEGIHGLASKTSNDALCFFG
jgi:hypothetical protein